MSTPYKYSIVSDTLNAKVDNTKLSDEIRESSISVALDYVSTVGDELSVVFKVSISSEEKELLDYVVAHHDGVAVFTPPQTVIYEDRSGTGGRFQMRGFAMEAAPGETCTELVTWPWPIRLLALFLVPANDGDEAEGHVAENTLVGVLSQDASEGDAVVHCSPTVFDHVEHGYLLTLGSDDDAFRSFVTGLNKADGTAELQTALDRDLAAGSPVKMTIAMSYGKVPLKGGMMCECGGTAIGGTYIPANTPLCIHYTNNSDHESTAYYKLEYWY